MNHMYSIWNYYWYLTHDLLKREKKITSYVISRWLRYLTMLSHKSYLPKRKKKVTSYVISRWLRYLTMLSHKSYLPKRKKKVTSYVISRWLRYLTMLSHKSYLPYCTHVLSAQVRWCTCIWLIYLFIWICCYLDS